jgi:hypothetical protein
MAVKRQRLNVERQSFAVGEDKEHAYGSFPVLPRYPREMVVVT